MDEIKTNMSIERTGWENSPYSPNPNCPLCKGAGVVHPLKDGALPDYSSVICCPYPGCLLQSIQAYKRGEFFVRKCGITEAKQTFATFQPISGTEKALKYAKALSNGDSNFIWLLIYGGVGNGKSHLCNAIASECLARGRDTRIYTCAEMFSMLRAAIKSNEVEERITELKETFMLILDDYGVEYDSAWEQAKFDEIMTARFANAKPTVLTTNRDVTELTERVRSRFRDCKLSRIAYNSAPDYRELRSGKEG